MHCCELLFPCLPEVEPPEKPEPGICCVTGKQGATVHRKHAILGSFTNHDLLKAPDSDRVSVAAWRVMQHNIPHPDPTKKRGLAPLRQSHWVCDGQTIDLLDRVGLRSRVIDGVSAARWAGYATTSYKKHGSLLAPVNTGKRQVWLWETTLVDCSDRVDIAYTWWRLRAAQDAGIHRPLIEALDISPGYIEKIGWRVWRDFEAWAKPRQRSGVYRFLTFLLPSMEELKSMKKNDENDKQYDKNQDQYLSLDL